MFSKKQLDYSKIFFYVNKDNKWFGLEIRESSIRYYGLILYHVGRDKFNELIKKYGFK